eukprot:scaffold40981_cov28-Tisochrysis_lutea.AAC.3
MKLVASSLQLDVRAAIDIARIGMIVARGYDVRYRTISASITPENRILVGLGKVSDAQLSRRAAIAADSDRKLSRIYAKIHGHQIDPWAAASATTTTTAIVVETPSEKQPEGGGQRHL